MKKTNKTIMTAFVNTKGGTSKTTSALNLAATAADFGFKTLLIDFDPQGSTSKFCEALNSNDVEDYSSFRVFSERVKLSDLARPTDHGFDLIAGTGSLWLVNSLIEKTRGGDLIAYKVCKGDQALFDQYDLVICDTKGEASRLNGAVMLMTGDVVIANEASTFAVDEVQPLLDLISEINEIAEKEVSLRGHFFSGVQSRRTSTTYHNDVMVELLGEKHLTDCNIPRTEAMQFFQALRKPLRHLPVAQLGETGKRAVKAYENLFFKLFPEFKD